MATQPDFGLLFKNPSMAELNLRKQALQNQQQAINNQNRQFYDQLRSDQAAGQAQAQAQAPGLELDNAKKLIELQQLGPKFEGDQALQQSQIASNYATASKTEGEDLQSRVGFISDKLGKVENQRDLVRFNRLMTRLGILPEDKLPQTVDQAKTLHLGSKMNLMQEKFNMELLKLDRMDISEEKKQSMILQRAVRLEQEKAKLLQQTNDKKFPQEVFMQRLRNAGKANAAPLVQIMGQQQGGMQVAPTGIKPMANGGPINAGQPYLVGEQGPEVIVPQQSGTVIPNSSTYGSPYASLSPTAPVNVLGAGGDINTSGQEFLGTNFTNDAQSSDMSAEDEWGRQQIEAGMQDIASGGSGVSKPNIRAQAEVEKDLYSIQDKLMRGGRIVDKWDDNAFLASGQLSNKISQAADWMGLSTRSQKDDLAARKSFTDDILQLKQYFQLEITGTAGSEKVLADLAASTLSDQNTVSEARQAAADILFNGLTGLQLKTAILKSGNPINGNDAAMMAADTITNYREIAKQLKAAHRNKELAGEEYNPDYDDLDAAKFIYRKIQEEGFR